MSWPRGATGSARGVILWLYVSGTGSSAVSYLYPASSNVTAVESFSRYTLAQPIALQRLVVAVLGTPYTTDSVTFTLRKNGVDTALTVTLLAGQTFAQVSAAATFAAGDVATLKIQQSGTEATANILPQVYVSDV